MLAVCVQSTMYDTPARLLTEDHRSRRSAEIALDEAWGTIVMWIGNACERPAFEWAPLHSTVLGVYEPTTHTVKFNSRYSSSMHGNLGYPLALHEYLHACGACSQRPGLSHWKIDVNSNTEPYCSNFHLDVGSGTNRQGRALSSELMTPVMSKSPWISHWVVNSMPFDTTLCDPDAGQCDPENPEKKCVRSLSTMPHVCGGPSQSQTDNSVSDITLGCAIGAGVAALASAVIGTYAYSL